MSFVRPFVCTDLFRINNINMDDYTETYNLTFYFEYLAKWPEYCVAVEAPGGHLCSYCPFIYKLRTHFFSDWEIGRRGREMAWTCDSCYSRTRLQKTAFWRNADALHRIYKHHCYFVDLFVRASNKAGVGMYTALGYVVYRVVLLYYSGEEDAYEMRIALSRDRDKASMRPFGRAVQPHEVDA